MAALPAQAVASCATAARAAVRAAAAAPAAAAAGTRLSDAFERAVVDDIFAHALKKQTGVSLKYMLDFGATPIDRQLILSAQFLQRELPVRLAHRVAELENLPYGLSSKPQVLKVRDWYVESFREIRAMPLVKDAPAEAAFTDALRALYRRHAGVVPAMARGVAELRRELSGRSFSTEMPEIHQFLDGFYLSRIGIRMLAGQHLALHEAPRDAEGAAKQREAGRIGLISTRCRPWQVASDAIADARAICLREYGSAPEVVVYGDPQFAFAYVPSHLHHMVFELVKNSLRAVQDRFEAAADGAGAGSPDGAGAAAASSGSPDGDEPPPIRLVVAEGAEDVTIKVSDEGGGIPRSGLARIWSYLYSTAKNPALLDAAAESEAGGGAGSGDGSAGGGSSGPQAPALAGYGYGLPLSRLYARYFGGDLQLISMEGYGTDAYLHLSKLGNVQEPLP